MARRQPKKPKLAVFKLASCDGCQLSLLDCEDELLAVAGEVDIAYFLEASSATVSWSGQLRCGGSVSATSVAAPHTICGVTSMVPAPGETSVNVVSGAATPGSKQSCTSVPGTAPRGACRASSSTRTRCWGVSRAAAPPPPARNSLAVALWLR